MFIPHTGLTWRHTAVSEEEASGLAARYHPLIRQFHFFADIYASGNSVILEAPTDEMLRKMAGTLNYLLEHPEDS